MDTMFLPYIHACIHSYIHPCQYYTEYQSFPFFVGRQLKHQYLFEELIVKVSSLHNVHRIF